MQIEPIKFQVTSGGPADVQGNLKKDDVIVSVNGVLALLVFDKAIEELFNTRPDNMTLVVKATAQIWSMQNSSWLFRGFWHYHYSSLFVQLIHLYPISPN